MKIEKANVVEGLVAVLRHNFTPVLSLRVEAHTQEAQFLDSYETGVYHIVCISDIHIYFMNEPWELIFPLVTRKQAC